MIFLPFDSIFHAETGTYCFHVFRRIHCIGIVMLQQGNALALD